MQNVCFLLTNLYLQIRSQNSPCCLCCCFSQIQFQITPFMRLDLYPQPALIWHTLTLISNHNSCRQEFICSFVLIKITEFVPYRKLDVVVFVSSSFLQQMALVSRPFQIQTKNTVIGHQMSLFSKDFFIFVKLVLLVI